MGILYDIFKRSKKRCTICGCHMYNNSDSDICEICLDELYESDPGEDEPGYPCLSYYDEHDANYPINPGR